MNRLIQRSQRQGRLQIPAQRPSYGPARINVQHYGQVDKLPPQPDVGEIGRPELVDLADHQILRDVGVTVKLCCESVRTLNLRFRTASKLSLRKMRLTTRSLTSTPLPCTRTVIRRHP
jgi:hypothetical protein